MATEGKQRAEIRIVRGALRLRSAPAFAERLRAGRPLEVGGKFPGAAVSLCCGAEVLRC